ncbi:hypothetical protein FALCPG4_015812 [Fusarium falciforme]
MLLPTPSIPSPGCLDVSRHSGGLLLLRRARAYDRDRYRDHRYMLPLPSLTITFLPFTKAALVSPDINIFTPMVDDNSHMAQVLGDHILTADYVPIHQGHELSTVTSRPSVPFIPHCQIAYKAVHTMFRSLYSSHDPTAGKFAQNRILHRTSRR